MTEEENLNYSMKNPWDVANLEEFLFYYCPECGFTEKAQSRDLFLQHASDKHQLAKYFLEKFTSVKDENPYKVDVEIKEEENGEYSYEENQLKINKNDFNFNSDDIIIPHQHHNKSIKIKTEKPRKNFNKKSKKKKKTVVQNTTSEDEEESENDSEYNELDFAKYDNKKIREINFTENNGDIKFHCDSNEENIDLDYYSNDETSTTTISENYKCATCDKTFRDSRGLACHMNTVHGGSKYQCDFCEKCFSDSCILIGTVGQKI